MNKMNLFFIDRVYPLAAYLLVLTLMVTVNDQIDQYLYFLFLALPLMDKFWLKSTNLRINSQFLAIYIISISIGVTLLILYPGQINYFLAMAFFVALPEEWFFRLYLLSKLGGGFRANILVSLAFSLLHAISLNLVIGCLVFIPSLFFGWLYLRTKDIFLTVLIHALSNLIFVLFIKNWLSEQSIF